MILLACGSCFDQGLLRAFPFLIYWLVLFAFWSLVWGSVGGLLARRRGLELGQRPLRFLALAPLFGLAGMVLSMGSLTLGLGPLLILWLTRLAKGPTLRAPAQGPAQRAFAGMARRVRWGTFSLALTLIPLAYLRRALQSQPDALPFGELLLVHPALASSLTLLALWLSGLVFYELRRSPSEPEPDLRVSPDRPRSRS